jgi:MraZ protein
VIKARFRSRTEHALDGKGRLNFPSRFREVLGQYDSDVLMVTSWGKKHLRIYPVSVWEILENKLLATKGEEQAGLAELVRYIVGGVTECTLDKQGRLLLPQGLRNGVNLQKDVVLNGMIDWIEIWDKEAWLIEHQSAQENFEEHEKILARLGIF